MYAQASSSAKRSATIMRVAASSALASICRLLLEGLVLAEIGDGQAQRVDGNERVRHLVLHDEDEMGDVPLPPALDVVDGCAVDLLEIDRGLERRLAQVL
jgi:hypothetical protein